MKHLAILLLCTLPLIAVGPKLPRILTFTASPSQGVTGYWIYWRVTNSAYVDTQRWPIPPSATNGYDLIALGLSKGQYYIMMTATNATSESDPSTEAPWDYTNPNKPSNVQVQ